MSLALEEKRARVGPERAERLFDPGGGRSLDESVSVLWESLTLRGHAHCLVCGGAVTRGDDEPDAEEAVCASCGSRFA
jgi:hypothetical protein